MQLNYDTVHRDVLILAADGGLNDQEQADQFVADLSKLTDAGLRKLIVDFTAVSFVNSFGLGVLIRMHKHVRARGGEIKLCGIRSTISHMIHDTRLHALFSLYPDIEAAKLAFTAA